MYICKYILLCYFTAADAEDSRDGLTIDRRCRAGDMTGSARKRRGASLFEEPTEESEEEETKVGSGAELLSG